MTNKDRKSCGFLTSPLFQKTPNQSLKTGGKKDGERRCSYVPTKRTVLRRKELKLHPPAWMLLSDLGHDFSLDCMQYISPSPSMICREAQSVRSRGGRLRQEKPPKKVCRLERSIAALGEGIELSLVTIRVTDECWRRIDRGEGASECQVLVNQRVPRFQVGESQVAVFEFTLPWLRTLKLDDGRETPPVARFSRLAAG